MPDDSAQRIPLDRGRVLGCAVRLADTEGFDAVTMRALATELDVVPMALYKHVANKSDLVDGMIDVVVDSYPASSAQGWRRSVRSRILAARRVYLTHPWMRTAIESRHTPPPGALAYMDSLAAEFIDGGIAVDLTHHAMHVVGSRIWGFTAEVFTGSAAPSSDLGPAARAAAEAEFAKRYPAVTAIALDARARTGPAGCDDDFEFEFAVDLILEAVERLHDAGWESTSLHPPT